MKNHYFLCEKFSNSLHFGKENRKTAARMLSFRRDAAAGAAGEEEGLSKGK